ncbi:MAG: ribose 5-phosphate isomerase B [Candidatus Cloacimonadota bacterium]|nr:ribose 5-phosphate isomerase B [Candidatus Cloacimonadota bacterium]
MNSFFPQKVAIASDHAAFELKEELINHFTDIDFVDFGTSSVESMDYPDTGFEGAEAVANNSCDFGIIMCGSGIGMSIVANKVKGIRAALCQSKEFAQLSRKHNNANVLVIPGRFTAKHIAFDIVDAFLKTKFEGGRHQRRIDKITNYETKKN